MISKFCLIYLLVVASAVVSISVSCGRQPDFMAPPVKGGPAIELASSEQVAKDQVVKNSYIVTFRGDNTPQSLYFSSFHDEYQFHYLKLQEDLASDSRIKDVDVLTTIDLSRRKSADWSPDFDVPEGLKLFWSDNDEAPVTGVMTRVDFSSQDAAKELLTEWQDKGMVWFAEPNGISRISDCKSTSPASSPWCTNYTNYKGYKTWWHTNIKLAEAFNSIQGKTDRTPDGDYTATSPIIAVLDSGTDVMHSDLQAAIWKNDAPGASGCSNDVYGCNTTAPGKGTLGNGDVWPVGTSGYGESLSDDAKGGHGTHVAGIVAAQYGQTNQVAGVCPMCRIMTVKIAESEAGDTNGDPKIRDDSQIRGFKYITRFKKNNTSAVRVANSSFGKYSRSRSIAILVDALRKIGSGTLVIAAASNEDSMIRSYPAALNNAVAVAALREDNQKASYSNFGPWINIAAPGGKGKGDTGSQITSTWPGGGVHDSSGTSMASPVVAGAVGLFLAVYPSTNVETLMSRLLSTADGSIYDGTTAAGQFNSSYYYPKLAGEDARRPLLGSGILDVNNFIMNSQNVAVGKPFDRVTPGCSTIGGITSSPWGLYWLVGFLASPLAVLMIRRKH